VVEWQGAVESLVINPTFWRDRRVFLTGHTGFKGGWTALLLGGVGAKVTGFSLAPEHQAGIFSAAEVARDLKHLVGDIRDLPALRTALTETNPEMVIHMAAQSLVRRSYANPVDTFAANVMGTVHVLEAMRTCSSIKAAIIVTSDKCYDNTGIGHARGYREGEPLGGADPYSSSKACAELVTHAYRQSYFKRALPLPVASVRAGNVIGGGDWAEDRLVPDAMRAFLDKKTLAIRNPHAIRPWQHVLDPIIAYLMLAERLTEQGQAFAEAWNFGPDADSEIPVGEIADMLVRGWGEGASWRHETGQHPPEAALLKLDCSKAANRLGWRPRLDIARSVDLTIDWYRAFQRGADMRSVSRAQIEMALEAAAGTIMPAGVRRNSVTSANI
jgi:CDP-glucose 4,6-dehydratase